VIRRVCWFVNSFVRNVNLFVNDFSKSKSPIFMKFGTERCSVSEPNFTVKTLEVRIKVKGQNRRAENVIAVAKMSSSNLAIRQK